MSPFEKLKKWLKEEESASSVNSMYAVLATTSLTNIPQSRVVAIREINEDNILFFTQKGTRKVQDLKHNKHTSVTFWFPSTQREVVLTGETQAISDSENQHYWSTYPRVAQIRFHSYAPTSGQVIESKDLLTDKMTGIIEKYKDEEVPFSSEYCGFRVYASSLMFYHYRTDELSDVEQFDLADDSWSHKLLSP